MKMHAVTDWARMEKGPEPPNRHAVPPMLIRHANGDHTVEK
jgi:hypothetical protein